MINWREYNLISALGREGENFWIKQGEKMALELFYDVSRRVPAYKDFLKKNKIKPDKIGSITDFSYVPPINKNNYLHAYPLEKLCWDGKISFADMISTSSGSSGKPFFWLRSKDQEDEATLSHEAFLVNSFSIDKYSTLFIVSFAMGMWVAGTLTYRAVQNIASKYNMTVITPGIHKEDVINIVKSLGDKYEQIVIAGYPPFVKDIIDEGSLHGLDWKKHKIKFLFAAESFSESWRDYLHKKIGSKNILTDSLNIYGTADALILGHETPLAILIRRLAESKFRLYERMFQSEERIPTLVQYNPAMRFFEQLDNNLFFTSHSGIPLIRYEIGDTGGIVTINKMTEVLADFDIDIKKEIKKNKIKAWQLPFLYVFGRNDFTASLYGVNIYPETIRDALQLDEFENYVSGKFTMVTKNDKSYNQYLDIHIEMKNSIELDGYLSTGLKNNIKDSVTKFLKAKNSEYNQLYKSLGVRAEPEIKLCQYGDRKFFNPGAKQKWSTRLR